MAYSNNLQELKVKLLFLIKFKFFNSPLQKKKKVAEMEEKYKKLAIYQTQLGNDKQKLEFEVDTFKDLLLDYEELNGEDNVQELIVKFLFLIKFKFFNSPFKKRKKLSKWKKIIKTTRFIKLN